jgi:hypothetical protein
LKLKVGGSGSPDAVLPLIIVVVNADFDVRRRFPKLREAYIEVRHSWTSASIAIAPVKG